MISEQNIIIFSDAPLFVDKIRLYDYFINHNSDYAANLVWHKCFPKSDYENLFDLFIKNLFRTTCIQIYQDGVIRIHLEIEPHNNVKKSIFIDDLRLIKSSTTVRAIEELLLFVRSEVQNVIQ